MTFQPAEGSADFPTQEEAVLAFWKDRDIYQKSLARREGCPEFVFYEGPPTANGLPHPGHCLTRAVKDLFPRYRTMRGYHCARKAGWDTHGLPVEVEVCKELGIHSKEEIEVYGVEPFIQKCQQSVWRYMREWERLTERLGFWVNLEEAYVTYHQSYVESVWWSLKQFFDRGLLYRGHKIVWWWAQGGTALSSGEVGLGYRQVADPSVFVRFPLLDEQGGQTDTSLLVWTTTPWTLPSNQFAAVHPELQYATVRDEEMGVNLIIAADLVEAIAAKVKRPLVPLSTCRGSELIGRRYTPPFDYYYRSQGSTSGDLKTGGSLPIAWRVVGADFVTTDSGTGLVHQAPAFGEVDFQILQQEQARFKQGQGPPLICAVGPDGKFTSEAPDYEGRWVKDCDKEITRELKHRGLLYHQEQYLHDYPFCWRAEDDPLIQYPRESWFVRTTAFKDELLDNNSQINWLPEHIKTGRMGKFLESNVDWALSRERYWGTPLPIWQCEESGYQEAVGSYEELLAKPGVEGSDVWERAKAANPDQPDDLRVHKPYIDAITYDSPHADGARMRRVPEVIDCWYDSGAMPFAQWGYRGQAEGPAAEQFQHQFPADFISEALDQTRGWFYSQLAISTLLFGEKSAGKSPKSAVGQQPQQSSNRKPVVTHPYPHPYRNCIVLGLMLGEDGQKMSKSKRNYREPREIFDRYGADALRWYFFATQPPWTTIRYSEQAIKESIPEFLLRLWNVYSFFVIYANIDGFDPASQLPEGADELTTRVLAGAETYRTVADRAELDRWVVSELHRTAASVTKAMDAYDNFAACQALSGFVDALSNWYVRRSRDRFWMSDTHATEKLDAYWTLYECLLTTTKLVAPFVPFVAETIWQNLACSIFGERATESVHLCEYPAPESRFIDEPLSERMGLVREIASLGRAARSSARLKVRQPLAKVEVVLAGTVHLDWLREHTRLIEDELNVKAVEFTTEGEEYITYTIVPNFKRLGPRLGKSMPLVKKMLGELDGGRLLERLDAEGKIVLELPDRQTVELDEDDIEVRLEAKEGWSAAQGRQCVVVLSTELTENLLQEGLARDLVRAIQDRRKARNCEYTDRIRVAIETGSDQMASAVKTFNEYIRGETLADELAIGRLGGEHEATTVDIAGNEVTIHLAES